MPHLICYCFEYTASDIREDVRANQGHSRILQRIAEEKKAGRCRCGTHHPEGR
jgi:hypothetical protein